MFKLFFNFFQGYNLIFSKGYFSYIIDFFHNYNCSLLNLVIFFVFFIFIFLFFNKFFFKYDGYEYQFCEVLCRVLPVFILLFQIFPSLRLLYFFGLIDIFSDLTIKIVGHQWYWSYYYRDFDNVYFDSYIKSDDILGYGELRYLDVDNRCLIPRFLNICFCITSEDVIHSWTLFNMSIKLDAISGILRVFNYNFCVVGLYYGQCSEICGVNHSFIPIVLEVTIFNFFKNWCIIF